MRFDLAAPTISSSDSESGEVRIHHRGSVSAVAAADLASSVSLPPALIVAARTATPVPEVPFAEFRKAKQRTSALARKPVAVATAVQLPPPQAAAVPPLTKHMPETRRRNKPIAPSAVQRRGRRPPVDEDEGKDRLTQPIAPSAARHHPDEDLLVTRTTTRPWDPPRQPRPRPHRRRNGPHTKSSSPLRNKTIVLPSLPRRGRPAAQPENLDQLLRDLEGWHKNALELFDTGRWRKR